MNINKLRKIAEKRIDCPLCLEALELDDLCFFPCDCGYQICRFCWNRILSAETKLCPACRKEFSENPANFKPITKEELIAIKAHQRRKEQKLKRNIIESRKHLENVRVIQNNLICIVGIPKELANVNILTQPAYFGRFGRIQNVVINSNTKYAGPQEIATSAYITYAKSVDALRAIKTVNQTKMDGRIIRTSLGTTKYCQYFVKNQQCPRKKCIFLHQMGNPEASFTKEEIYQGKHQQYEKRLIEEFNGIYNVTSSNANKVAVSTHWITKNATKLALNSLDEINDDSSLKSADDVNVVGI